MYRVIKRKLFMKSYGRDLGLEKEVTYVEIYVYRSLKKKKANCKIRSFIIK